MPRAQHPAAAIPPTLRSPGAWRFWAAVILDFAEVPARMMPAMFTCGRTAGWCAHILEQKRLGKLVRPAAIYVGPAPRSPESVTGWDRVQKA